MPMPIDLLVENNDGFGNFTVPLQHDEFRKPKLKG
jgi:hypothetical protein